MSGLVLIIEDEKDISESLVEAIEGEGYSTISASNGVEAIGLFEGEHDDAGKVPDLILLDLLMPQMNGASFLEKRAGNRRLANVPVVLMSADRRLAQNVPQYGAAGYLHKPLELDDLFNVLEKFCKKPNLNESRRHDKFRPKLDSHDGYPSHR